MHVTSPDYISQEMFDEFLRGLFCLDTSAGDLRQQVIFMLQRLRASSERLQILTDIESVVQNSSAHSTEQRTEIAYVMGMQIGFELAAHYPPRMLDFK
jgi:hypothetical protein